MFGWLRRRKEETDLDDIKSGILGRDEFFEPEPSERLEPPRYEPPPRFEPERIEPVRAEPRFGEPFAFGEQGMQEPKASRDYDILERLNLIETNLLAIRSQTETINERLKNLEMKLTSRRY